MIAGPVAFSPADRLQRAAELLSKHWTIALPTALASVVLVGVVFFGVISVVVGTLLGHAAAGHVGTGLGLGTGLVVAASAFGVACLALLVAHAISVAAAPEVLADRAPDLAAAFFTVVRRLPDLIVAFVACLLLAIVPLLLCFVLIGIPLIFVLGYLLMYVPAAVIIGGEGGLTAIATSIRIARTRVGESVVAWLGLFIANVVAAVVNGIAVHIPFVNLVIGFVVGGLVTAYAALVIVDFYGELRSDAVPQPQPQPVPSLPYGGPPTIIR